jgi:hypothetical protein
VDGASPNTPQTHIAIPEQLHAKHGFLFHAKVSPIFVTLFALEKAVDWLEEVSEEQYQA